MIKSGQGKSSYWAFVPHPLPPKLPWDDELVQYLSNADRALGELAGMGRNIQNPGLFVSPFIRREAVLSSRIEGTNSDLTDLYVYEAGQLPLPGIGKPAASKADVREVHNYVRALEFGLERMKVLPVSLRLIREIHARLLEGVRGKYATPGEFRVTQNWIGGETIGKAIYVPPPVPEMKTALDAFEKYLQLENKLPPLIRLALIHYQFEAIHPFVDGNGRIGRLLLSLLLVNWNLLPLPLLYLSAYFESRRQTYYDLLLNISQRGAWREWVIFFLQGVATQSLDTLDRAKQLQDLQIFWRDKLNKIRTSTLLLQLVDLLFKTPIISVSEIQKLLKVSNRTARQYVEKLEELDILKQLQERKYARIYYAPAIIYFLTSEKSLIN